MKIIKKYYSSLILLFIGILMARTQIILGDECKGMPDGFLFLFLFIIYSLILLFLLIRSVFKYLNKKESFNYFPIVTTLLVGGLIYLSFQSEKFESSTIFYAESEEHHSLSLRKNSTFKIQMRADEWSCYYQGDYTMTGDTLYLLRKDIQTITDNTFSDKYLLRSDEDNNRYFYPMDGQIELQDTPRILKLEDKEY